MLHLTIKLLAQSRYAASMPEFPRLLRRGVYPELVEGLLAMTWNCDIAKELL